MQFDNHETDLYILPETQKERHNLQSFCETKKISFQWSYSNIKGQNWEGKQFLEIPFGVCFKDEIIAYFN